MNSRATLVPFDTLRHSPAWAGWHDLTGKEAPFLGPDFFALVRPLAGRGEVLVGTAESPDRMIGALPLVLEGDVLRGLRSDHSPSYDYTGSVEGLEAIWRLLRKDRRWNELVLDKVPASSRLAVTLPAIAKVEGFPVVVTADTRHPYLPLGDVTAQMNPKFRSNLQRCLRKAGNAVLERILVPTHEELDEACAIEARAWKGAAGSAIESDTRVDHVYRAAARLFGRRGQHSLYFLRAGGVRIATLFAVEDQHGLYALKIGYDPAHANLSPGHLLVWLVAQDAEQRGLRELDFIGREDEWKRKWTERVHPHVKIVIYQRSLRGLTRYTLREKLRPRLPEPARTTPRSPLPRRCQHADVVGVHTPFERIRARVVRGFGIRSRLRGRRPRPAAVPLGRPSKFEVGSWVRVRDLDAVGATLDANGKLRGLAFVPTQRETTGQVFRVERHVRRLRDDRGVTRTVHATVLLAGVDCSGTGSDPTGCGRHCPLMYRDEWLEPAAPVHAPPPTAHHQRHARVRDLAAIYASLDAFGRHDGITFMPEMAAYAGQRFAIANELTEVYECGHWTYPVQPVCILTGLHCTGNVLGEGAGCDRACALLWHRDWLMIDPA